MLKVATYGFVENEIAYYRHREPVAEMARQGLIEYRSSPNMAVPETDKSEENRRMVEEHAEWADVLFTERYVTADEGRTIERLRHTGLPWVLDIDDHVLSVEESNPTYDAYRRKSPGEIGDARIIEEISEVKDGELCFQHKSGKLAAVAKPKDYRFGITYTQIMAADAVIVPSMTMRGEYWSMRRAEHEDDHIHCVPYSIDTKRWAGLEDAPDHSPEVWIGWLGSSSHIDDMAIIEKAVEHVLDKYKHVRFFWRLIPSKVFDRLTDKYPDRCVFFRQWVKHDEWPQYFASSAFDIVLAPLTDTPFNRCRSPMKWMEAGMRSAPTICSRTDGYVDAIHNRKDGYLCSRTSEWVRALEALIESPALRQSMGAAAHEAVLAKHTLERNAPLWAAALQDAVDRLGDRCRERALEEVAA